MKKVALVFLLFACALSAYSSPGAGNGLIWQANFETGDLSEWSGLIMEHGMFVQIGILRDQQPAVEQILVDNVRHGESIDAVLSSSNAPKKLACEPILAPK